MATVIIVRSRGAPPACPARARRGPAPCEAWDDVVGLVAIIDVSARSAPDALTRAGDAPAGRSPRSSDAGVHWGPSVWRSARRSREGPRRNRWYRGGVGEQPGAYRSAWRATPREPVSRDRYGRSRQSCTGPGPIRRVSHATRSCRGVRGDRTLRARAAPEQWRAYRAMPSPPEVATQRAPSGPVTLMGRAPARGMPEDQGEDGPERGARGVLLSRARASSSTVGTQQLRLALQELRVDPPGDESGDESPGEKRDGGRDASRMTIERLPGARVPPHDRDRARSAWPAASRSRAARCTRRRRGCRPARPVRRGGGRP